MRNFFKLLQPDRSAHFFSFFDEVPESTAEAWSALQEKLREPMTRTCVDNQARKLHPIISVWRRTPDFVMTAGPWSDVPAIVGRYEPDDPGFKNHKPKPTKGGEKRDRA